MMRVMIFVARYGYGGVERMFVHLARGLATRGFAVDFLTGWGDGPYLDLLADTVHVTASGWLPAAWLFIASVRRHRPDVVLTAKPRCARIALAARRLTGAHFRLVYCPGIFAAYHLARVAPWRRSRERQRLERLYRGADAVVGICQAMAEEAIAIMGTEPRRVHVIRNPVVTPEFAGRAAKPLCHRWFESGRPPVVLGVGTLKRRKDFATLIRAFVRLRAQRPAKLIIIGDGSERECLVSLATRLGIDQDVDFLGFVDDPSPYMKRARVFILPSQIEGAPNVLIEALACGTPVVSTDCGGGTREILADGRYGPLVPVGDDRAMAEAVGRILDDPPAAERLRQAVSEYALEKSADRYGALLRSLVASQPEC
jgi:glycosyltransferase involved in cell wall biosynthesis